MSTFEIRQGDCLEKLREMPDESVHMVCTSPPYWGLRSYGTETWEGGSPECDHKVRTDPHIASSTLAGGKQTTGHQQEGYKGHCGRCGATRQDRQLGLEATPDEFVANMVEVFREVRRVLRKDGTCWLNIGDSYAGGGPHNNGGFNERYFGKEYATDKQGITDSHKPARAATPQGLKAKDLCMIPARLALALQANGWWIRSEITWCKRAPMPESVRDRPTSATEKIYLLTKSAAYYFDSDAVREPSSPTSAGNRNAFRGNGAYTNGNSFDNSAYKGNEVAGNDGTQAGRNMWNYWLLSPDPYSEAHFATFPREIPRRAILAGTSERGVCGACGAPWKRVTEVERNMPSTHAYRREARPDHPHLSGHLSRPPSGMETTRQTTGWQPTCPCDAPTVPATVLDPFAGAGTTLLVAVQHGRRSIGIELNPDYIKMALKRIHDEGAPLFAWADGQVEEPTPQAVSK